MAYSPIFHRHVHISVEKEEKPEGASQVVPDIQSGEYSSGAVKICCGSNQFRQTAVAGVARGNSVEGLYKALYELIEVGIGAHHTLHLTDGVDDRRVVFSAEALADVGKAGPG